MRPLSFGLGAHSLATILCLGAHADDIEIGCGGTILRLIKEHPLCRVIWVVFSGPGSRTEEARHAAKLFAGEHVAGQPDIKCFQDGFMPFSGAEIKLVFEELKQKVSPDLVFTHNRKDSHQDHRLLAELTWNTFRDHLILEYEIPKYDGDLGQPSVFVPLDSETAERKIEYIMEAFPSQHTKRWFQPELFRSLMRLRGMECNAASGYAEAFYCRKLVL
jgi:LmbE family N-acetylglucosaminyl deacetylase